MSPISKFSLTESNNREKKIVSTSNITPVLFQNEMALFLVLLPCSSSSSIIMSFAKEKRSLKPSANKKKTVCEGVDHFSTSRREKKQVGMTIKSAMVTEFAASLLVMRDIKQGG